jgi:hypothetical protein
MPTKTANPENHMNDNDESSDFDPTVGLAVAETWWALGRWLQAFHRDEPAERRRDAAHEWIAHLFKDGKDEWVDDAAAALTPDRLQVFAEDIYALLERKYRGGSIGDDVLERMRHSAGFRVDESGQFVHMRESAEVWWANEYREVFLALDEREKSPSWTFAAAYCANENCKRFFIKRRPNQRYHSESCQARSANKRSYRKHRSSSHRRMSGA